MLGAHTHTHEHHTKAVPAVGICSLQSRAILVLTLFLTPSHSSFLSSRSLSRPRSSIRVFCCVQVFNLSIDFSFFQLSSPCGHVGPRASDRMAAYLPPCGHHLGAWFAFHLVAGGGAQRSSRVFLRKSAATVALDLRTLRQRS